VTGYPAFEEIAADSEAVAWQEIVPRGLVTGDARHAFKVSSRHRYTHVRLNIFPDGGVARLRVHGEVVPDPAMLEGLTVDPRRTGERRGRGGRQRPERLLRAA